MSELSRRTLRTSGEDVEEIRNLLANPSPRFQRQRRDDDPVAPYTVALVLVLGGLLAGVPIPSTQHPGGSEEE